MGVERGQGSSPPTFLTPVQNKRATRSGFISLHHRRGNGVFTHEKEKRDGRTGGRTDGRTVGRMDGSRSQGCGRPAQRGRGGAGVKEVGVGGVACSTLRQKPTQRNKRPEIESFVFGFLPPVKNCDAL